VRVLTPLLLHRPADPAKVPPEGVGIVRVARKEASNVVCWRSVSSALNPADLVGSRLRLTEPPEIPGASRRG
jgi:hypothetical protein